MSIEAMKLALEAWDTGLDKRPAMEALRTTIAEAEKQEPVAWLYRASWGTLTLSQIMPPPIGAFPVYTTPPAAQRQWVGLTEQERNAIEDYCEMIVGKPVFEAIEAKLKEKNT